MSKRKDWLYGRLSQPFDDECVEWPFSLNSYGYGVIGAGAIDGNPRNGRRILISHLSLESVGKTRPEYPSNCALHSCDNASCFNPNHLEWRTKTQNIKQRDERGRTARQVGEINAMAKLTVHDVEVIFAIKKLRFNQREIAEMFGRNIQTIGDILTGRTWGHLGLANKEGDYHFIH